MKTYLNFLLVASFGFLFSILPTLSITAQNPIQVAGTATKTATSSGNWTSTATWGGSLPGTDARVLIPSGITVTVDSEISTEFKSIRIEGTLKFATNVNTELRTEYLVSSMMGTLEIGTSTSKIATGVSANLVFAERGGTTSSFDPNRFVPGAVLMGPTTMHGADKTSWLALQTHPSAGATQFTLKSAPTGWQVGDQLVVAGTDPITNASINSTDEIGSDEVVTITNVSGSTVTFTPALVRNHKAPSQASDLDVHVANLSRNIIISSENTSVTSISGEFRKPRGHIMFMHNLNVNLKYVEANNLGRTDKTVLLDDWDFEDLARGQNTGSPVANGGRNPRGRYSFHFHRGGLDESVFPAKPITPLPTPAHVEGCVVNTDPGWGFVNHSSRVNFVKNVSYNVVGSAFSTESGNETGSFVENIAIRTINPNNPIMSAPRPRDSYTDGGPTQALSDINEGRQDFAWQGDGFWLHGAGVTVQGNVVAGCTGHAYVYWTDGLIEKGMGMARGDIDAHVPASEFPTLNQALKDWKATYPTFVLDIWYLKSRPFTNNTAYGFSRGVQTYYVHTEFHQSTDTESNDPELWFNDLPAVYKDQLDLVLDGTTLWNIGKVGFEHNHTANVTIQNSRIVGYGCRTGYEDYGTNPAPNHISYEPEVIGLDLDFFHNTHRWNLYNNTIEGFSGNAVGVALPINAVVTMNGGTFNNAGTDILIGSPDRHLEEDGFGDAMLSTQITKPEILIEGNISFQNPNNNIVMDPQLFYHEIDGKGFPLLGEPGVDDLFFFAPQEIKLNFGPFDNAIAYFNEQDASYMPITSGSSGNRCSFGDEVLCISNQYANKTNTQLEAQYNKSFAGAITPNTAVTHPIIIGGKVSAVSGGCAGSPPVAPSSVTASNNACNSIDISWSNVNCADDYSIQRKVGSGNWVTLNSAVTGTSYTDNNPAAEPNQYRVRAQNVDGNSAFTNSNSIDCSSNPTQYTLTTNTSGNGSGSITLNPSGGLYDAGTIVTITATANTGSQFDNWSGSLSGTNNPITITMNTNKSVTANFSTSGGGGGCTWSTIDTNDFESGWGIWNDGGSDCRRSIHDDEFAISGEYCVRLRDNTNTSVMTTDNLDLSGYDELKVEFAYICESMDNSNEDFWLQISTDGGGSFTTIEEWNEGDEFENEVSYTESVTITGMTFTTDTKLRFRCDASGNADWVYIDDVTISGCGTGSGGGGGNGGTIDIVNFSFEEPGIGDFEDDFSVIPGWNKGGNGDTGIEKGWNPTDGDWICFHEEGDNYINQTLDHAIEAGKTYTLELDVIDLDDNGAKAQVLLRHGSTNIQNVQLALNDAWQTMTVTFDSDDYPNAIGEDLRIFFRNNGEGGSYAGFDNLRLTQSNALNNPPTSSFNSIAVGEEESIRTVKVFPNPLSRNQSINLQIAGFEKEAVISIIDSNGRLIQRRTGDLESSISTQNLPIGLYFIKVFDKNGMKITRFVIQD
jgi:hypothetical protein